MAHFPFNFPLLMLKIPPSNPICWIPEYKSFPFGAFLHFWHFSFALTSQTSFSSLVWCPHPICKISIDDDTLLPHYPIFFLQYPRKRRQQICPLWFLVSIFHSIIPSKPSIVYLLIFLSGAKMEHLNPANKVLASKKKPKQQKLPSNKHKQKHVHVATHSNQQIRRPLNGTVHSSQRPHEFATITSPSPSLNGPNPNGLGPIPQFHLALVILAFFIIGLAILCAFGCCLRTFLLQRKKQRKRREKAAEEEAELGERERLVCINQFIARKQSAAEGDGGEDNLGIAADNLTLNGGTLPQIKVTESNENREEEMNGINEKEQQEFGRNIAKNQPNG